MRWRVTAAAGLTGLAAVTVLTLTACSKSEPGTAVAARSVNGTNQQQSSPRPTTSTRTTPPKPSTTPGDCSFKTDPGKPAPPGKDVGLPPAESRAPAKSLVLTTSQGDIPITLSPKAPCTVRSFAHLAGKKFFDGTSCHRLTSVEVLKVLQCGDPTGLGIGGPGYTIPDENPTDLPVAPASSTHVLYQRGLVAMANTGAPHSGGSQFFIVYADSTLPASYAVFGTIDAAGLATVDKVAAGGIDPNASGNNGPQDGAPKVPVTIQQTVVAY
jgi:peptidyl-prolyl cis-trans isomerase B (cyclophilin B)